MPKKCLNIYYPWQPTEPLSIAAVPRINVYNGLLPHGPIHGAQFVHSFHYCFDNSIMTNAFCKGYPNPFYLAPRLRKEHLAANIDGCTARTKEPRARG